MASDLAAIRAEGRRLMAAMEAPADDDPDWIVATDAFGKWMYDHASDLLADPAPSVPVVERPLDRIHGGRPGEADRPKAAQVLAATALGWVLGHGGHQPSEDGSDLYDAQQADLLAHGSEYGVAILADGSLRPLTDPAYQPEDTNG